MADAVWPPGLPPPQVRTLSETPQSTVQRTKMSIGPDKVRKRTSLPITVFACEFKLTRSQVATLMSFLDDTIAGGALAFEWIHPRTGVTIDARIVGVPTSKPSAPRLDGTEGWTVSCQIETFPAAAAVTTPPGTGQRPTQSLLGDDPGAPPADEPVNEDADALILGTFALGTAYTPAALGSWPFGETTLEDATVPADEAAMAIMLAAAGNDGHTHMEHISPDKILSAGDVSVEGIVTGA